MRRFFLAILVLLSGCASAQWTTGDTIRQGAVVALQTADYLQTRHIVADRDPQYVDLGGGASVQYSEPRYRYRELNPILGERPTTEQVNAYFAASIVGNALISCLLPPSWRVPFQYISIGYEAAFVVNNFSVGVRW